MVTRWFVGVSLGFNRSAKSCAIATSESIVKCRSLCRRLIENRWSVQKILQVKATPWSTRKKAKVQQTSGEAPAKRDVPTARAEGPLQKAFRINNNNDLVKQGFTDGCD